MSLQFLPPLATLSRITLMKHDMARKNWIAPITMTALLALSATLALATGGTAEPAKTGSTKAATPKVKSPPKAKPSKEKHVFPTIGSIERLDPAFDFLIPTNAVIEKLAEGFNWSEGPVWFGDGLLFSDIPTNRIYKWTETGGIRTYIEPAGYSGSDPRGGEPGSNGLTRDRKG